MIHSWTTAPGTAWLCRISVDALMPPPLFLPRDRRPGLDLDQHLLEVDPDAAQQRGGSRMRAQGRLELLEETVHLVAHVEDVLAPRQVIAEHHDVLERGAHQLQLVLDVFQALAGLRLDVMRHHLASARPSLLGSPAWASSNGSRP